MKIKEGFELRTVCGENVIVATGLKNIDFSKIIGLNESAALMLREVLDGECEVAAVVKVVAGK